MAVPKKCTFASKKRIRKNFWKRKGYWTALKGERIIIESSSFRTTHTKRSANSQIISKPLGEISIISLFLFYFSYLPFPSVISMLCMAMLKGISIEVDSSF